MKFAPMNYHYLRYPIKKFLDKVERSPFNSIDLYCSAPQLNLFDYPLLRLIELKKEIEAHHLSVMAMTPENCVYPVNFCTQDDLTRESSIRYYQRAIDTAQFLDCPCVQISTGFGYFDQPREEGWKYCRESLWTLAQYCEKKDVRLLLEELKVTTTNVLITSKDIAKMLEEIESPSIVGMVDMDQMTYAKETIDDYFDNLGDKLQHIHFNDRGHTVPGDGDFPMKEYYDSIKNRGYDGTVSFEICDRRYYRDPDKAIDDIVAWMKDYTEESVMWTQDMFGVEKPIIALLHLDALPGDPGYCGDMKTVTEHARKDLLALQDGGVDGILFANEFSLPYQPVADIAVVSAMAYIIGKLKDEISVPFGVNVVKNPIATIDLGAATGAKFGRSCFSGAYMGEYGVYVSNSGEAIRHRKALGIEDMKLLFKVNPEADAYLVQRDVQVVAKSIMFGDFADGLCVSGAAAGAEPDDVILSRVHEVAKPRKVPVFCNTGCNHGNVREKLGNCDGVCMGTAFKKDGVFNGRVDKERVREFMEIVADIRKGL